MSGRRMRSGTPGNPAPEPTSATDLPAKSATVSSAALSTKCSRAAAAGSVMAVRLVTLLTSKSRRP